MKIYLIGKLSEINYNLAIHRGDANRRLASEAIKIYLLPSTEVPTVYKDEFTKLRDIISKTIKNLSSPVLTPTKLIGINNVTAAKYLKLLIDIADEIQE